MNDLLKNEARSARGAFQLYTESIYSTNEQDQQLRLWKQVFKDRETLLWAAFLWAASYDGTYCWVVLSKFPELPDPDVFEKWHIENYERIKFDVDFRWKKSRFPTMYRQYLSIVGDNQFESLNALGAFDNFKAAWNALDGVTQFGRLSRWDYVEALNIFGFSSLDAPDFALKKAESVRNGVAYAIGAPKLSTKKNKTEFGKTLSEVDLFHLNNHAEQILAENNRADRLGLETVFCWWKKKACRENNSRYFGYDEDKAYEDILFLEKNWPEIDTQPLLIAREKLLPGYLLAEKRPVDAVKGKSKMRMKLYYRNGILPEEKLHLYENRGLNEFQVNGRAEFRDYHTDELLFTVDKAGEIQ